MSNKINWQRFLSPAKNKYGNRRTTLDGIVFDSKKEADRYGQLMLLSKAGEISGLVLQKEFLLQPAFVYDGMKLRKIVYVCDFFYHDKKLNRGVVEDVKGYLTTAYKLKRKMFLYKYAKEFVFREIV
jgi:hypothetical protein